ncbi:hypothetical protein COI_0182 [Mannheimia haemolytica serotype A2 str. OVINE]|nr:hypothetical protein B824_25265 [Mannheimia haemolytica USDA-ARS-USMARC-184]EEY11157.1 hypothetical protein COI_0182 [Mannheimia haemolytica serotype A2 str. OVINE]EEY11552.1 hypothetical protein COK_2386 [Mannheimia haemolytica serotype A2 str. BOVINE]TRC23471.1 hypothetical protein FEA24_00360 [Mannheimia haemolytica]TRC26097.1 hypothetical protein FEA55_00305 [Mannheimia haemolytica]
MLPLSKPLSVNDTGLASAPFSLLAGVIVIPLLVSSVDGLVLSTTSLPSSPCLYSTNFAFVKSLSSRLS